MLAELIDSIVDVPKVIMSIAVCYIFYVALFILNSLFTQIAK